MQNTTVACCTCVCAGSSLSSWNPVVFVAIVTLILLLFVLIFCAEIYFIWRRCNERQQRIARRKERVYGDGGASGN